MNRQEFNILLSWAFKEGWNHGLNDAEIFWQTDTEGFGSAKMYLGEKPKVASEHIYGITTFELG
jgi:hypothetical protein